MLENELKTGEFTLIPALKFLNIKIEKINLS